MAGRELFKLYGMLGMRGVEKTASELKKIDKQALKVQRTLNKMGRNVSKVGMALTKAFTLPMAAAGVAVVKFIEKGGDLNETISKTNELFGESSQEIQTWANTAATSIGQTKQQAMDAAGTFAIFGKSAGLAGKDLVDFAKENTELASDMASFFNTKPEDAIMAIGAAYRGETEPIRRYGVMLDDATMRQKAFELGLVTSTKKALLPQTKVLAAQALIFEKTKAAQGDFARTSDQLANKQRILSARIENVSATIGSLFLPLALKAVNALGRVADKVEGLIEWWVNLNGASKTFVKGLAAVLFAIGPVTVLVGKLVIASKALVPVLVALKTGTLGWSGAMAALSKSVMGVTLVIGALVAVGWYYHSQWGSISKQVRAIWEQLKLAIVKMGNFMVQTMGDAIDAVLKGVSNLAGFIPGLEAKIQRARVAMLKFRSETVKGTIAQQRQTAAYIEQAEATDGFMDSVKKAIEAGKEKLGLTKKQTEATQFQTQIEKEQEEERKKHAEAEAARIEQEIADKEDFNLRVYEQLDQRVLTERELLDQERGEQLMKAEELGADVYAVKQLYSLKAIELEKQEAKEKYRTAREGLRTAASFGNRINNVLGKFSQNNMARIDREEKRKIEAIQNSQMTEEQKETAIMDIKNKMEKKRLEADRKRARREKLFSLFSIAINTAAAVVKALPNIPLSIAIGVIGAIEAAAVASQPQPFFEGAMIGGSQEGITAQVGERNQDEVILPLERGVGMIADGILDRLSDIEFPTFEGGPEAETGPEISNRSEVHLHIGTLVADQAGLKKLYRELNRVGISEDQRKGVI